MARRATWIENQRKPADHLLLLSAGGFYGPPGILNMYKGRFLSRFMIRRNYTAVAVGRSELNHGLLPLEDAAEEGLPLICANLYRDGERLFPPYLVREAGRMKIGIFALLGEYPLDDKTIKIRDPLSVAGEISEQLRSSGTDYIILLAHMNREALVSLVPRLSDVDVIIRGGLKGKVTAGDDCVEDYDSMPGDLRIPVLTCGRGGRAVGKFIIGLDGELKLKEQQLVYLDKSVEEDRKERGLLTDFYQEQGKRMRKMKLEDFMARDKVTGRIKERYLGMETCRRCHPGIGKHFVLSPHFQAFERLSLAGEEKNEDCFACHTTGYGRFSGYSPMGEEEGRVDLRGVQCEACHGPGTMHSRDGSYVESAGASCRRCHIRSRSPDFELKRYLPPVIRFHGGEPDSVRLRLNEGRVW